MKKENKYMLVFLFILYVILASSGLVLFKLGSNSSSALFTIFNISLSFKMILGILCYGFSFLLWLYIISHMNLTFAMPLSVGIVNTLVVIESCLFLGEKVGLTQGIGIFIIVMGVMIMTYQPAN